MQIQLKVVLLVAVTVVSSIAAVIWKTSGLIREDKSGFIADVSEKQLAPVRRLVQAKLDVSKGELVQFALRRQAGGSNGGATSFGGFDVVSLVFDGPGSSWVPTWVEKRAGSSAANWPQGYDMTLLKSLPYGKLKDGDVFWIRRADKDQKDVFVIMVSVDVQAPGANAASGGSDQALPEGTTNSSASSTKRGVVVGFSDANPLNAVTEDYIGSLQKVYVVDDQGYVASHVNKGYTGKLFTEDPLVKEIEATKRSSGKLSYFDIDGDSVDGRWEKIERTNLHAVVAIPQSAVGTLVDEILRSMMIIGGAAAVAAIFLAFFVGSRVSSSLRQVQHFVSEWQKGNFQAALLNIGTSDEVGQLAAMLAQMEGRDARAAPFVAAPSAAVAKQVAEATAKPAASETAAAGTGVSRSESFRQTAQGIAGQLREPINAILGQIQLLKSKAGAPDAEAHALAIERDARLVKTVVDLLNRVAGEDAFELRPSLISDVVAAALASVDREIKGGGVHVERALGEMPLINASATHLQAAIREFCLQAIASLRNRPKRELSVRLQSQDGKVRLAISDNGVGLTREGRERFFDPFFQPYEGAANPGLGMAMAKAVLERHLAEVRIESNPGNGTVMTLEFPVSAVQTLSASAASTSPTLASAKAEAAAKVPSPAAPAPSVAPSVTSSVATLMPPPSAPPKMAASEKAAAKTATVATSSPPPAPSSEAPLSSLPSFFDAFPTAPSQGASAPMTLGGKGAISEDVGNSLPPLPFLDENSSTSGSADAKLELTDPGVTEAEFRARETEESRRLPDVNLPPMDLSRTAPPPPAPSSSVAAEAFDQTVAAGIASLGETVTDWKKRSPTFDERTNVTTTVAHLDSGEASAAQRGKKASDIEVPASFLNDDEPESFSSVGLGRVSQSFGPTPPSLSAAAPHADEPADGAARVVFAEPEPQMESALTIEEIEPESRPAMRPETQAESPLAPPPPQMAATAPSAPPMHEENELTLTGAGSGQFKVKIRRPKTRG